MNCVNTGEISRLSPARNPHLSENLCPKCSQSFSMRAWYPWMVR